MIGAGERRSETFAEDGQNAPSKALSLAANHSSYAAEQISTFEKYRHSQLVSAESIGRQQERRPARRRPWRS
ncbi:hypothetical protein C4K27_3297 [Pseudomonas chlororaphis subsp. chlororaphis]|nr:hypothetical protein C4K27_3297 [Pseudomonas chlororaphis subsp. chlororaphis]